MNRVSLLSPVGPLHILVHRFVKVNVCHAHAKQNAAHESSFVFSSTTFFILRIADVCRPEVKIERGKLGLERCSVFLARKDVRKNWKREEYVAERHIGDDTS
jgi:hypothetical protein